MRTWSGISWIRSSGDTGEADEDCPRRRRPAQFPQHRARAGEWDCGMSYPWVFRLYAVEGSTLFVRACVHESRETLEEHWQDDPYRPRDGTDRWHHEIMGYCREIEHYRFSGGRLRRDPCVAEVHLFRDGCRMSVVTHEMLHATMAWARRTGFGFGEAMHSDGGISEGEEWLAYLHGNLCRDFVDRWAARRDGT